MGEGGNDRGQREARIRTDMTREAMAMAEKVGMTIQTIIIIITKDMEIRSHQMEKGKR